VEVVWKSGSGKIYKMSDSTINCEDIQFAFDKFDAELYKNQVNPRPVPFKINNLRFNLEIQGLNTDCNVSIELKSNSIDARKLALKLDKWINNYNETSLKKSRFNGVIHSWKTKEYKSYIIIDLDLGSTGSHFMEGFLRYLSETKAIEKVVIS
jgi:hypothetical protein